MTEKKGSVGMKRFLVLAVFTIVALPVPAHAAEVTQFAWDRTGAENLPCAGEQHWRLTPAEGINDGVGLGFNDDDGIPDGESFSMIRDEDSFTAYVPRPLVGSEEVLVAFTGEAVTQPTLSLVDCVEGVTEPPPIPTTNPEPTPPTESSPPPTLVTWNISFMVTTPVRTNVVVRSRVTCSNATDEVIVKRRLQAKTPIVKHLPASLEGATSCRIRVVAYDIKPWNGPHGDGQHPKVTTWVTHT